MFLVSLACFTPRRGGEGGARGHVRLHPCPTVSFFNLACFYALCGRGFPM